VVVEPLAEDAAKERFAQIADYYEARTQNMAPAAHSAAGAPYKPLPPDRLYLAEAEWRERLDGARLVRLTPFAAPEGTESVLDAGTRQGRNFAPERTRPDANVFEAVKAHVDALQSAG
jgi:transcription-repair coupling factor (superfamily II helicase)